MDGAFKASFEAQFGTEWSQPVVPVKTRKAETSKERNSDSSAQPAKKQSKPAAKKNKVVKSADKDDRPNNESDDGDDGDDSDGPVTVKHNETERTQSTISKGERRKFFTAKAPPKEIVMNASTQPENTEDLANDLALQRLIEESHILSEQRGYTGADVSGVSDPLEAAGKTRVKVMEARLAKAGARQVHQRAPQAMIQGIRAKSKEREAKKRASAKESGVVLAREHKVAKVRKHDKGLRINSVGKANEYGVSVSSREIARVQRQGKSKTKKRRS